MVTLAWWGRGGHVWWHPHPDVGEGEGRGALAWVGGGRGRRASRVRANHAGEAERVRCERKDLGERVGDRERKEIEVVSKGRVAGGGYILYLSGSDLLRLRQQRTWARAR